MSRFSILVALFLLFPMSAAAIGGIIGVENSGNAAQTVYCTPQGNGDVMSRRIFIQIFNDLYDFIPITSIPASNIRLYIGIHGFGQPHISWLCSGTYITAATGTNTNGIAYFPTGPFNVFNNAEWNPYRFHVEVYYNGVWNRFFPEDSYWGPCKVFWITPDLNGDRSVGFADNGIFATRFGSGEYDKSIDFLPDGVINMGDVGRFAAAYGESCAK